MNRLKAFTAPFCISLFSLLASLPVFAEMEGSIQIYGMPDASIILDSALVGVMPNEGSGLLVEHVAAGAHVLTASRPGYFSESFIVEVKPNRTTTVNVELKIDRFFRETEKSPSPEKPEIREGAGGEGKGAALIEAADRFSIGPPRTENIWERDDVATGEWLDEVTAVCNKILFQIPKEKDWVFSGYKVIDEAAINAFASPDGIISFNIGMLEFMKNENELAMLCGHEIGHVTNRHFDEDVETRLLAGFVKDVIDKETDNPVIDYVTGDTLGEVVGGAILGKFSRSQERQADETGLFYAWDVGYDPRAGMEFWWRLVKESSDVNAGYKPFYSEYLKSHPVDEERSQNFELLMERGCKENIRRKHCVDFMTIDRQYKKTLGIYEKFKNN